MSRYFSIDKVPFGASVLGLAAMCFSAFVTFRPNRIAAGEAVSVWKIHSDLGIAILAVWAVLIVLSAFRKTPLHILSAGVFSSAALLLTLAAAGAHAKFTLEHVGSVARISLGPAFWLSIFFLILILADLWKRSENRRLPLLMVLLSTAGAVLWMLQSGTLDDLSIMREFGNRRERFFDEIATHLMLAGGSVGIAVAIGIPLGLLAHRSPRLSGPSFFTLNTLQTVPSLALFGILIPVLAAVTARFPLLGEFGLKGIGAAPAVIALTVYSLLPVARNTYAGFKTVDPSAIEAGRGMGMTRLQLLMRIEVPIASPVILNGIRVAMVQAIGLTAVAALIGAGGLGVFIFQGLGQAAEDLILLGAVPTIAVAVAADLAMNGMTMALTPKGLR